MNLKEIVIRTSFYFTVPDNENLLYGFTIAINFVIKGSNSNTLPFCKNKW